MSTRGAYGFRINGVDKVTYNHFDSYPSGLGNNVLKFINYTPIKEMREIAGKIILVDGNESAPDDLIEKYKKYSNDEISTRKLTEWYVLLNHTQGELDFYKKDLSHMIDNADFLHNSLFCEWAYIINLDTEMLEVYEGFNKNPGEKGRYANKKLVTKVPTEYCGVKLIEEIPLKYCAVMSTLSFLEKRDEEDE